MTFVPPVLYVPTPESRRQAIARLHGLGITWGAQSAGLDADLAELAQSEIKDIPNNQPSIQYLDYHKPLYPDSHPFVVLRSESSREAAHTKVNSLDHFISYLRRHGKIK